MGSMKELASLRANSYERENCIEDIRLLTNCSKKQQEFSLDSKISKNSN